MSQDSQHEGVLLRRVAHDRIRQLADILENPLVYRRFEMLAVCISQGNERAARQVMAHWLRDQIQDLRAQSDGALAAGLPPERVRLEAREDWRHLRDSYYMLRSMIDGLAKLQRTELALLAETVAPDYGRIVRPFDDFVAPGFLKELLEDGTELIVTGHNRSGKSNLMVLLLGHFLAASKKVHVSTNINGISRADGKEEPRLHRTRMFSDMLRTWCTLPDDAILVAVFDEVERAIKARAQNDENVSFDLFRNLLGKMRIVLGLIYHREGEQLKTLRKDAHDKLVRIHKPTKTKMLVTRYVPTEDGEDLLRKRTMYEDIPATEDLTYVHDLPGNLVIDVNVDRLLVALNDCDSKAAMKSAILRALQEAATYNDGHVPKDLQDEGRENAASEARTEDLVNDLLLHADKVTGVRGTFIPELIRELVRCTAQKSHFLAKQANDKLNVDLAHVRETDEKYRDPATGKISAAMLHEKAGFHEAYAAVLAKRLNSRPGGKK